MQHSMTCSCGMVFAVDAENREEAISQLKEMMNMDMMAAHMAEKHPGEPVPTLEEAHAMIEQNTK